MSLGALHGALGGAVLATYALLALLGWKNPRGTPLQRALTGVGHLLLLVLVILGWTLWARGNRPSPPPLDVLHLVAGTGALAVAVFGPVAQRASGAARRALPTVTLLLILITWAIGFFS